MPGAAAATHAPPPAAADAAGRGRRRRALKKAQDEKQLAADNTLLEQSLRIKLVEQRATHEAQHTMLGKLGPYAAFMKRVLGTTDEFSRTDELVSRHKTLSITNDDLLENDATIQQRMEEAIEKHRQFKEAHQVFVLDANNRCAQLTLEKDRVNTETLHWDAVAHTSESTATKRTLLIGKIRMATANLYQQVEGGASQHIPTESQLDKIQVFLSDLQEVASEYERSRVRETAGLAR